jgi:hypothetical protein
VTSFSKQVLAAPAAVGQVGRRWVADRRGAALVQFVVVLPILILVVMGLFSVFTAYSARYTLCESVWEATRYLQVEGPQFDPTVITYPAGWEDIATTIINNELASNRMSDLRVERSAVVVTPPQQRLSPKEMSEVRAENVDNNWFFIKATAYITNPLGVLIEGVGEGGKLAVTCKGTGFFEGPPIGPTPGPGSEGQRHDCPPQRMCTAGPPPTECAACTPTPEPTCPPCKRH